MGIIEREPGSAVDLPSRNAKVTETKIELPAKVADVATAAVSTATTETIDGAFYGSFEQIAAEVRPLPVFGPILANAILNMLRRVKKAGKAPASRQENQAQAAVAKSLHSLAVVVDATAFWIGDFSQETYNALSRLTHVTMPRFVEEVVAPVRKLAASALKLASLLNKRLVASREHINSLAQSLPWNFHADTFDLAIGKLVFLFDHLWHKVYTNIENRLHGAEADIRKLRAQVNALQEWKAKTVTPTLNRHTAEISKLLPLAALTAFILPIKNLLSWAQGVQSPASTAITNNVCEPVGDCAANKLTGGNWSKWAKDLFKLLLFGTLDAILLADLCQMIGLVGDIIDLATPEIEAIASVEGGLIALGCVGGTPPLPPPAYT